MSMKGKYILLLLAAAGTLSLAGCQKTGIFGKTGDAVRSSASAGPAATKTVYSGENASGTAVQSGQVERIDWLVDDQIRIWSDNATDRYNTDQHYSDYRIWKITKNGIRSEATIINAGTYAGQTYSEDGNVDPGIPEPQKTDNVNGLVWKDAAPYAFYGIYPAPKTVDGSDATLSTNGITFNNLMIDADQGAGAPDENIKKYGFMTAAKSGVQEGATVSLDFAPAFTAFEIQLKAKEEAGDITVMGFELISEAEALAGTFSMSYNGTTWAATCPTATDGNKTISVSFGEDGQVINANTGLNFTVFALPQDFTQLKLRFTIADENAEGGIDTRSLPLKYAKDYTDASGVKHAKGNYVEFGACKKHRLIGLALDKYQWIFKAVELGLKWDVDTETLGYASDPIINAGSLYHKEGAVPEKPDTNPNHWTRTSATFAGPNPIKEYFTVFAPANGSWVVTNSDARIVTLSAENATSSSVDEETHVQTLTGAINGRVDLTITRVATGTANLDFYVKIGNRLYSINSEVTRGGAQVITVPQN